MLTVMIAAIFLGQAPMMATAEPLPIDKAALDKIEKVELKVTEDGRSVTYSGIPLDALLKPGAPGANPMARTKALSDAVILVRGEDGYQAAVSAAAAAMDPKGERYFLALARDGKPLDAANGPSRLMIPGDPRHVRWVKGVASIHLVRLGKITP